MSFLLKKLSLVLKKLGGGIGLKRVLAFLHLLVLSVPSFSISFVNSPVVKTPFPIKSLCWNSSSSLFAFCEDDLVFIRDSNTFSLVDTISTERISSLMFSKEGDIKNDVLLTLSDEGTFCVWDLYSDKNEKKSFTDKEPIISIECDDDSNITCASFSKNSDYIAISDDKFNINLYFKLRYTRQTIKKSIQAHSKEIYGLEFCSNNSYLVSSSFDNKGKVWDLKTNSLFSEFKFYSKSKVPIIFTDDSNYLIATTSKRTFSVFDLNGEKIQTIKTLKNIEKIKILPSTNIVAVLTSKNNIELYNLEDYSYYGYIPPYNITPITSYAFNSDSSLLLIGHEDGSIYKFVFDKVFLKPDEEPPAFRVVTAEELVAAGSSHISAEGTDGAESTSDSESNLEEIENLQNQEVFNKSSDSSFNIVPSYKPYNSLLFSVGATYLSEPFVYGGTLFAEYRYGKLLSPIFFGVGVGGDYTYPVDDFPYTYNVNGQKTEAPNLLGIACYVPFGVCLKPWSKDIFVISEVKLGTKLYSLLLNTNSGVGSAGFSPYFYFATSIGCLFKFIGADFIVEYDSLSGFYPAVVVSYQLKVGKK